MLSPSFIAYPNGYREKAHDCEYRDSRDDAMCNRSSREILFTIAHISGRVPRDPHGVAKRTIREINDTGSCSSELP
jgi:hypothetical protein